RITLSKKTLNLKLYYNLEKIRTSHIIEEIEKLYDFPIIVLFGSFSSATDSIESDVDMCIISNIEKEFPIERYEKILNRKISLHIFTKNSFAKAKRLNKELINNICNGIVLSGELEVL
ncbi:nucleotidyltransferase domain-containing protein, partial [Candidatus Pacearchaeota archaeon]|nr:nucleotidyltransferase domain-containing protein [Candidatus Pacearchaeota archaeon]